MAALTIALTGATGALGAVVLDELLARGHRVNALVRPRAGRTLREKPGVTWVDGALDDPAALDVLVVGADAILHAAYCPPEEPPPAGRSAVEHFVQTNVAGTLRLVERTPATRGAQLVFVSSLAVHGTDAYSIGAYRVGAARSEPVGERDAVWPADFYGAHKAALEKLVIAAGSTWGVHTSAFRVGCVLGAYSSRARDPLAATVDEAKAGGAIRTRKGAWVIGARDTARILADALGDEGVRGGVFHTFDRWLDFGTLAEPLAEVLGRRIARACDAAPPPQPGLSRAALDAWRGPRAGEWTTDACIRERLRALCADRR